MGEEVPTWALVWRIIVLALGLAVAFAVARGL